MEKDIPPKRIVVLRKLHDLKKIEELVNKKKVTLFGSVFKRLNSDEIQISSINLIYEQYWIISGRYIGNYFRKENYEITTAPNVIEVKIGNGIFPTSGFSGTWTKIKKGISGQDHENQLKIPVEEHVKVDVEDEITINPQGLEIKFPYKIDVHTMENYPEDVLKDNNENIRRSILNESQIIDKLVELLREDINNEKQVVSDKLHVDRFDELYVPVYEARCVNQQNTVKMLRVDAMKLKIL